MKSSRSVGPRRPPFERILVVADRDALIGRQLPIGGVHADPIQRTDGLVRANRWSSAAYFFRSVHLRHGAGAHDRVGRDGGLALFGGGCGVRVVLERLVGVEGKTRRQLLGARSLGGEIVRRRRCCGIGVCGTAYGGAAVAPIAGSLRFISTNIGFGHRSYCFGSLLVLRPRGMRGTAFKRARDLCSVQEGVLPWRNPSFPPDRYRCGAH